MIHEDDEKAIIDNLDYLNDRADTVKQLACLQAKIAYKLGYQRRIKEELEKEKCLVHN